MKSKALITSLVLAFSLLFLATSPAVLAADHLALVRVAHLSPDAPAVDIWVDGSVVLSEVPFKTVSDYLELPEGSHRIQVSPAGETSPIVIDATVQLEADTAYTVAATGLLGEDDLSPLVLVDDLFNYCENSKVRFVHTSPDAPAVDVGPSDGSVLFGDVAFRGASEYAKLPAGTYDLEVRVAGTMDIALVIPDVTIEAGTNYTVFAIGKLGDGTLAALPVVDES